MHISGSGPLGVLLMIAPLAAIPVFAILGVPQFAPVVASGADDDDFADLGESSSQSPETSAPAPAQTRSANDLYAKVAEPLRPAEANGATDLDRRSPLATASSSRSRGPGRWLPPTEALDQWEIRTDVSSPASSSARNERSRKSEPGDSPSGTIADGFEGLDPTANDIDDGQISAEGFNPDLLKADRASQPKKGIRSADDVPLELPPDRRSMPAIEKGTGRERRAGPRSKTEFAADVAQNADPVTQFQAEQSGWQDAARRLKKLGIRKCRLEPQIDEQRFVFICSVASPDNPRVIRRFEADADDPLEAVQQVLEQIDQWRSRGEVAGGTISLPDDEN